MPVRRLTSCFRAVMPFSTRWASGRSEGPRLRLYTTLIRFSEPPLALVLIIVSRGRLMAFRLLLLVSNVKRRMVSVRPLATSRPTTRKV